MRPYFNLSANPCSDKIKSRQKGLEQELGHFLSVLNGHQFLTQD